MQDLILITHYQSLQKIWITLIARRAIALSYFCMKYFDQIKSYFPNHNLCLALLAYNNKLAYSLTLTLTLFGYYYLNIIAYA